MIGALVGALVSQLLPPWLAKTGLVLLLVVVAARTLRGALRRRAKEMLEEEEEEEAGAGGKRGASAPGANATALPRISLGAELEDELALEDDPPPPRPPRSPAAQGRSWNGSSLRRRRGCPRGSSPRCAACSPRSWP